MAYEIRFAGDLMIVRFLGIITREDLRASLAEVEGIEASRDAAPDRITDLSESDADEISFDAIEELVERRRAARLKNRVKSAIFAPGDVQFGFSRMFQSMNDNPQIEVAVFREPVRMASWLGIGALNPRAEDLRS